MSSFTRGGPCHTETGSLSASVEQLDVPAAVQALERSGCFVVRGALPVAALDVLATRVRQGYADLDEAHASGALSPEEERRCYSYGILRPFEHDLFCADGLPMRDHMQGLIRESILREIIKGYLGDHVTLLLEACHVRKQGPGQMGRPVPLHQDASVMRMLSGRLLNFWVPLVDGAGRDAPGLTVFPISFPSLVERKAPATTAPPGKRLYSNYEIEEDVARDAVGNVAAWSPVLDRGDVLCLDGWSIHRTAFDPEMKATRYDFEMRFCRTRDLQPSIPGQKRDIVLDEWGT